MPTWCRPSTGSLLKLHGSEAPFFELPDARVTGVGLDLVRQAVDVARIAVKGGHARLRVDENGMLNVERAARETTPAAAHQPAAHLPPNAAGPPGRSALKDFALEGFAVDYEDVSRSPGLKAGIESIGVHLKAEPRPAPVRPTVNVGDIAVALKGCARASPGRPKPRCASSRSPSRAAPTTWRQLAQPGPSWRSRGGAVDVRREADGALNLVLLSRAAPDRRHRPGTHAEAEAEGHPFQFVAKRSLSTDLQASVSDLAVGRTARCST